MLFWQTAPKFPRNRQSYLPTLAVLALGANPTFPFIYFLILASVRHLRVLQDCAARLAQILWRREKRHPNPGRRQGKRKRKRKGVTLNRPGPVGAIVLYKAEVENPYKLCRLPTVHRPDPDMFEIPNAKR